MKLIAYQVGAPHEIHPAGKHRDWINRTPDQFARRCLPIMIANQHGWTIHTPTAAAATWDGTPSTQGITVHGGPPISHFGSGVLTWHVPYLFRTQPDQTDPWQEWGLYIKGPANQPRDGIIPLEGLVETDWASQTFTMNWLFTRPSTAVWQPGEPYCHLFPIPRGLIDTIDPEIQPIAANPELHAQYAAWSQSRSGFNANPDRGTSWQKHYHQGRHHNGDHCPVPHQTRLNLKPFTEN